HRQAVFRHVSASSSFRVNRLERNDCHRSLLDSFDNFRLARLVFSQTTLDNLRTHGVRVVCGSKADLNSSVYDWMVLSPGIDPVSPLARDFSSRGIETISELELGWCSCEMPVMAVT